MDSFEINKIIAAVLLTALIIIGIGKFADVLFHVEKPKVSAYKVEGLELKTENVSTSKSEVVVKEVDIKALLALGDIAHGENVFKKCSACHMIAADGKNKIGPNLWGVIGRQAAAISDYKYSKAMIDYGKEWSFKEMNAYLIKPQAYIKGTKNGFRRFEKRERSSFGYFIHEFKSENPLPLP